MKDNINRESGSLRYGGSGGMGTMDTRAYGAKAMSFRV